MSVKTGGPIRGFVGRWVMRFEATGQIMSLGFQGTTAVSALSGVLAYTGFQEYVPYVLGFGVIVSFAFAYIYVDWGLYNRKNREKEARGNNFAKPQNAIDDAMIARNILAAKKGRELTEEERNAIEAESIRGYRDYHDGIEVD